MCVQACTLPKESAAQSTRVKALAACTGRLLVGADGASCIHVTERQEAVGGVQAMHARAEQW